MPNFLRCAIALAYTLVAPALALSAAAVLAAPSASSEGNGVSVFSTPVPELPARLAAIPTTVRELDASAPLVERWRDNASDMVSTAMSLIGVPYRRGGTSAEHGFDCSGFTREVFEASLGLLLPRRAEQQARAPGLRPVKRDALQPGDLVFFNTLRRSFSHVGIYLGEGKFIHSPSPGGEVRVDDLHFVYWAKRFTGARRAPIVDQGRSAMPAATLDTGAPRSSATF